MANLLILLIFGIFLIYISICGYRFIKHRKNRKNMLRFMTSSMILFTLTLVCYKDIFFIGDINIVSYEGVSYRGESKVFLNSDFVERPVFPIIEIKVTAYFDNASPARGSTTNLIVTGPPKGKVTVICHYKGHSTPYIMDIGGNGQAVIPIMVESDAEPRLMVVVDVLVSYEGKLYKTNAVFTPQ